MKLCAILLLPLLLVGCSFSVYEATYRLTPSPQPPAAVAAAAADTQPKVSVPAIAALIKLLPLVEWFTGQAEIDKTAIQYRVSIERTRRVLHFDFGK